MRGRLARQLLLQGERNMRLAGTIVVLLFSLAVPRAALSFPIAPLTLGDLTAASDYIVIVCCVLAFRAVFY